MTRHNPTVLGFAFFILLWCLVPVASHAADPVTIQLITGGGGANRYGQVHELGANGKRGDYIGEINAANRKMILTYLAYYPETLDGNGMVEMYSQKLFPDEWPAVQRSPDYRNPIKRTTVVAQWRARIEALPKLQQPRIRLLVPVMVQKTQYKPDTGAVPVSFRLEDEMFLTSGETQLRCIQVDKEFTAPDLPISQSDLDGFFAANQNNRVVGRTASIIVEVILDITGIPEVEGVARPRCQLAAKVQSISTYEYRGQAPDFTAETAVPGPLIQAFAQGEPDEPAAVTAAFDARELPQDAPPEATAFNLRTHNGLIVMSHPRSNEGPYKDLGSEDAKKAMLTYGEFVSVGLQPEAHAQFRMARCTAQNYLSPPDFDPYFPTTGSARDWRGDTEFEQQRVANEFKTRVLPKLQARAVKLPQRLLLVSKLVMPEYDFDRGGFRFEGLTLEASITELNMTCGSRKLWMLPLADQLREFWKVDAGQAEAVLSAIPVDRMLGERSLRVVYLATQVELVNMARVEPVPSGPNKTQPPMRMKILSATLYGDEDLTQKVFSPEVIKAKDSVLEAGLPGTVVHSASYDIDYRSPDLLATLKEKGDFEEWEWLEVARQQQRRDTNYYLLMSAGYHRDLPNPTPHDTQYTPFFPSGYDKRLSNRGYDAFTAEQKQLFKKWAKQQAAAL